MDTEDPGSLTYSLVMIAFALMVFAVFFCRYIGRTDLGLPISLYLGMIMAAIRIRWDLRRRAWFWVTISITLLLHIPLVFALRLPNMHFNRVTLLPIGLADCVIILGAVRLVEKFMAKRRAVDDTGI